MKKASRSTTVTLSSATLEKLKNVKQELGLKNMDALMEYLLSLPRDPVPEDAEEDDPGNEWEAPGKRRKKDVRPPLYSMSALAERPGMLEFYTGFDFKTIELLIRRLEEVGRLALLFFFFLFPVLGMPALFLVLFF